MGDTLYTLTTRQNKVALKDLYAEFGQVLWRDKVFSVLKHAPTLDRLVVVEDATATLENVVPRKSGDTSGASGLSSEKSAAASEAEGAAPEEIIEACSPAIEAHVVKSYFRKNDGPVWKTRMLLDAHRRRRSLAPLPFVYLHRVKGTKKMTAEDRDAEYSAAHEQLRQTVLDSHVLRDKAEKADGEGKIEVPEWLCAEATRMSEEERVAGLEVASRFFAFAICEPFVLCVVTDKARVIEALNHRAGTAQDSPFADTEGAVFSVDLHMQRGKEVAPVLNRAVRMIVRSHPEARVEDLLDLSVDMMFGLGSHSDHDKGPSLPRIVMEWLVGHNFLEHSKDVVMNPGQLLCAYRISVRAVHGKQEREDVISRSSVFFVRWMH